VAAQFKIAVDQSMAQIMNRIKFPIATAAVEALQQTAADIVDEGRSNIASSGRFGANWQRDLVFQMKDTEVDGEPSLEAKAIVFHKSALAFVFEEGITIAGKPLLWIPTSSSARFPSPSRFVKRGGKLTFARIRGTPVLFDAADKDRHRRPLYIGVPSVRIAKKWRIFEIAKKHVEKIGFLFVKFFRE
jgi:hypothetical protein